MKDIHYPLDPTNIIQFSLKLNEELRSIDDNFKTIEAAFGNSSFSTCSIDLAANGDVTTISGDLFLPKLTAQPRSYNAVQWVGDSGLDVTQLIQGFVKNGEVYDVLVGELVDAYTGVVITILK